MTEEWRPVVGFEGYYEISDSGRARSIDREVPHGKFEKILKGKPQVPYRSVSGHLSVDLYRYGRRERRAGVHRLVLEAFVGPCPDGTEACHVDGDPRNNHRSNLYWGTRSDNCVDSVRHGTHPWAKRDSCANGHEFTPENTFKRLTGGRGCYTCNRKWKAEYKARKRVS